MLRFATFWGFFGEAMSRYRVITSVFKRLRLALALHYQGHIPSKGAYLGCLVTTM
jgi:hypothetical protein